MKEHTLSFDGIRAILFDFDGTLRHSRPSFNHALLVYTTGLGVSASEKKRRRALRWAHYYFADSPEIAADYEEMSHDEDLFLTNYSRRFLIAYGCRPEQAARLAPEIYQCMQETFQPEDWIDPVVPGTLNKLKTAGFTLGVVSNRPQAFDSLLQELGLSSYFCFSVAAGEVNSWKPDAGIFHHAMERAGSCPECTIYVGDNYYADVVGAQRAGVQPVLLDPEELFPDADCPVIRSLGELGQDLA